MISMGIVKLPLIEIIYVITMGDSLVATCVMPTSTTRWGTTIRVLATHGNDMFIVMPFMRRVEMTFMQVVNMTIMLDCCMAAMFVVNMGMVRVNVMTHQVCSFVFEVVLLIACLLCKTTRQDGKSRQHNLWFQSEDIVLTQDFIA
jgi:hypothetical protein